MWKKLLVLLITSVSVLSISYVYYNTQMSAEPALHPYYDVGDVFERTGTDTLSWGGMDWKLVYADANSHDGYILSDNAAKILGFTPMASGGESVRGNYVDSAILYTQGKFNVNLMDETMEMINKNGFSFGAPSLMSLTDYLNITNNESNHLVLNQLNSWGNGLFWLKDTTHNDGIHHLIYWKDIGTNPHYQSYQWIHYDASSTDGSGSGAVFRFFYKIKLPQKGILQSISSSLQIPPTIAYSDSVNHNGNIVATIDSVAGEGPYRFYIYDTNAQGNSGDYAIPSAHFSLSSTSNMTGANQIIIDETHLKPGDYYIKVRIVDESKNELLYYEPSDFSKDPYRSKETGVIHVKVTKSLPTIVFDDSNQTKKNISDAASGWSETATATPNDGVKITYSKVSGDIGLIDIDPNTGAITYKGSNAYGKVKIRATADDDPAGGNNNYDAAYVEKEIVIYSQVDGSVVPHANSSDVNTPTFTAGDANVKAGGTIGTIKGAPGTPDNVTSGGITYSYGLKSDGDGSFFAVNASTGVITTKANLAVNSYHIVVTVSDKWSTKEIPVTINVGMAAAEDLKFYETSAAVKAITTKSVKISDIGVKVFATVKGSSNSNPVTYAIKDGSTNVIEVNATSGDVNIHGAGTVTIVATKKGSSGQADATAELTFTVTAGEQNFIYTDNAGNELPKSGSYYTAYKETYSPSKTFQLYTAGNPTGSIVTYQLKAGSPTDVISVDSSGLVTIQNASMTAQIGKVIVQATSHDPSGNYTDKTIELPIDIEKGTRTIAFADNPVTVTNGSGSVTPNILVDGVMDTSGTATIEVDSKESSTAWTSDGVTIQYRWTDENGKDIKLHVTKPADRNYKIAEADGQLHILGAEESALTLSTPGRIIYGDHFTIRSTQDDSSSTNVQYTFTSDNAVFISAPAVSGNKAEFDALGNSGSTMINIKVTRTADGEVPLSKTVQIQVLPKPITIEIEDKTKKRLEDNPTLTIKDISSELVSWGGVKDAVDTSVVQLSTTAKKYSSIGTYPITSKNYTTLNDNYPNYTFTLKEGKLNVLDNGNKDFWDVDDDGCPDLNIKIKDDQGNPITINGDLNDDGIPDYNIDSNGDGKPDLNIDTDNDELPDINLVMLKEWKPSRCVEINGIQYAGGINAKPSINIDTDNDLIPDINIDTDGDMKADMNISKDGKTPSINIGTVHTPWQPDQNYTHQGFRYDTDVECKPYLNIDSDGDGRPDINLDLDDDGKPDINIDIDSDGLPDTNIDSTGDGRPDINIDRDGDGTPDENIKEITEWKPEHNVDGAFPYDTMKFEERKELEDNGVKVEKPDGTFTANITLKVTDITENKQAEVDEKAKDLIKNQSVIQVFDVKLLENGKEIVPDSRLKVKLPVKTNIKNPKLLILNENGEYEQADVSFEDGYLIVETDRLGQFAIIGNINEQEPDNTNAQGYYYPGANMGGALTGDSTNILMYIGMGCLSLGIFALLYRYHEE